MADKDYAFAPGQEKVAVGEVGLYELMRELVNLRRPDGALKPTTILAAASDTLEDFLIQLQQSPSILIPRPMGDLVLVSHASETGWLDMTLTNETRELIGYEALDGFKAVDPKDSKSGVGTKIRIPSELLKTIDGRYRAIDVIIKGCRIGIARPFLLRLKEALRPSEINVAVLAPKHYQAAYRWRRDGSIIAYIEFLAYCFESYSLIELKNRPQVINLFKSDKHKFFDHTEDNPSEVPAAAWIKWIPSGTPKLAVRRDREIELQLPATWDIPDDMLPDLPTDNLCFFKYEIDNFGPWPLSPALPKANAQAVREHICAQLVLRQDNCKSTHRWPLWKRILKKRYESFTSLEELVAGYNWEYDEATGWWMGTRHLYRCVVPITNPVGSNILLGNYYPVALKAAHVDLDITNTQLFEWVNE
jgi:hypothetical protein